MWEANKLTVEAVKKHLNIIGTSGWKDYELIDTGNYEKLERFGEYILRRPEPQAAWDKGLDEQIWQKKAHITFRNVKDPEKKGEWIYNKQIPQQWFIDYHEKDLHLKYKLSLNSVFKHVGLFPEQAAHWYYIFESVRSQKIKQPKVLNLFAYTGASSLAAKAGGADVVHVDSVKQMISWAKENMEASNLENIRWVVEDAMLFVKREVTRGNTYQGIILDPPAFGRGPKGELWKLEEQINEMIKLCGNLLDEQEHFFLMNLYSMGFSSLILENLIKGTFPNSKNHDLGELYIADSFDRKLPLSTYFRFRS